MTEASLYIHIPFCARKCFYCDFYSRPVNSDSEKIDDYIAFLHADILSQLRLHNVNSVPTIYIGGGTPSILGARGIKKIFDFLRGILVVPPLELTVEANPESITKEFIEECVSGGVTRLSVGIQSLNNDSRAAIGRFGDASNTRKQCAMLAGYGIDISFDMLSGLPFQDRRSICADIRELVGYGASHVSLYDLNVEEGTQLEREIASGRTKLPAPEDAAEIFLAGREELYKAGFIQYEVSNFSRPGFESQHNMRYWRMKNWLGAGKTASGTIIDEETGTGRRFCDGAVEELDTDTLIRETIMMGFRCAKGPDEALFIKRFKKPLRTLIPKTIALAITRGQISENVSGIALNSEGLLYLNVFLRSAFSELG